MAGRQSLTERHLRAMRDVVEDARRDDGTERSADAVLPPALLRGLYALVPCDQLAFSELDIPTRRELAYQEEGLPDSCFAPDPGPDAYWQWRHAHPLCLHIERCQGNTPVLQLSDFVSPRELRRLPLYTEYLKPIKASMAVALPTAPGRTRVFIFVRERARPFSEAERLTLELLRPHLDTLYREAARRRHGPTVRLTARELDVMRAVAGGLGNEAIARHLVVSPHTVRKHLENVFRKLGVDSRTAAVARVFPERDTDRPY
ncbi:response regulator transcription factor [Streptomyces sp. NBC_01314]|uniref:helix-turn-helix transcriptional regulator n=1 Tax=Streptomyces sp. NBC_01314 TaxID=2903821 RepID=UPI003092D586|nr:helix-turn-helix transcriptional regulator [Streptomyces sp. NBC_01314]